MEPGKILVANRQTSYLLKFVGDIRVTLCASLNRYIEGIFHGERAKVIYIDMLDTQGVDSTTLGLLVKLGKYCREVLDIRPIIYCTESGLIRTLETMSIDELFDIISTEPEKPPTPPDITAEEYQLPEIEVTEDQVRKCVLEAHKLLVELDPKKWGEFVDLIRILENHDPDNQSPDKQGPDK